jgi:pre-rRNA-processing protein TSR3
MQEVMIREMEREQDERSESEISFSEHVPSDDGRVAGRAKEEIEEAGDLLVENPNHTGGAWRPHHSDNEEESEEEEQEEEDDADYELDKLGNRIKKL